MFIETNKSYSESDADKLRLSPISICGGAYPNLFRLLTPNSTISTLSSDPKTLYPFSRKNLALLPEKIPTSKTFTGFFRLPGIAE